MPRGRNFKPKPNPVYQQQYPSRSVAQDATNVPVKIPAPEGPPLGNSEEALYKRRFQPGTSEDERQLQGLRNFMELKGDEGTTASGKKLGMGARRGPGFAEIDSLRQRYSPDRGEAADITFGYDSTQRAERIMEKTKMLDDMRKEIHEGKK